jgi:hypothetical protein
MHVVKKVLYLLILTISSAYGDINNAIDGRWRLTITGEDRLEFGTQFLAGGLIMRWRSMLDFSIQDAQFNIGTGTAQLLAEVDSHSRPEDRFNCEVTSGTFVSKNGQTFTTPHLRYQSFPMQGRVIEGEILLNPFLEFPGNYYAVLYECSTRDELGDVWTNSAPRVAQELGKRQSSQVVQQGDEYVVKIKEVKNILPGPELKMPLKGDLAFTISEDHGARVLEFRLQRLP